MRVVFASARSAPGVTTAVLAFASVWPSRILLVEAGEDGGSLAARFGLPLEPGVTTLAAAARHDADPEVLWAHTQDLPGTDGRITALLGPPAAEAAQVLLRTAAGHLAGLLAEVEETDVLIDAGRLPPIPAAGPLLSSADRLVLVARPRVEELQSLVQRLPALGQLGPPPQLLLIGERPYGPGEVGATLGCPVLGVLADDRPAADALAGTGSGRRLSRSLLLRSAASLVDRLTSGPPATEPAAAPSRSPSPHVAVEKGA